MLPVRAFLTLLCALPCAGCASSWADVRRSPYYPDRLTAGVSGSFDRVNDRWDKILPGVSVSWPLKPTPTAPVYARGEGEAP